MAGGCWKGLRLTGRAGKGGEEATRTGRRLMVEHVMDHSKNLGLDDTCHSTLVLMQFFLFRVQRVEKE